jgi:hypothetical protein
MAVRIQGASVAAERSNRWLAEEFLAKLKTFLQTALDEPRVS